MVLEEQSEGSIVNPAYGTQSSTTLNTLLNTFIIAKTIKMATRKMPQSGKKNTPFFDVEKPQDLSCFFERMENWFAEENIETENKRQSVIWTLRLRLVEGLVKV